MALANKAINPIIGGVKKVLQSQTMWGSSTALEMLDTSRRAFGKAMAMNDELAKVAKGLTPEALKLTKARIAELSGQGWSSLGKGLGGYFSATDHAGRGLTRAGIAAVRIGTGMAAINVPHRLLAGGGIFRDERGNPDIIGVPFI